MTRAILAMCLLLSNVAHAGNWAPIFPACEMAPKAVACVTNDKSIVFDDKIPSGNWTLKVTQGEFMMTFFAIPEDYCLENVKYFDGTYTGDGLRVEAICVKSK